MNTKKKMWIKYLCNAALLRRYWYRKSKNASFGAILNFLGILFLVIDMPTGLFQNYYVLSPSVMFILESVFLVIFVLNFGFHLYLYMWPEFQGPYPVPETWKELLQIPCEKEDLKYWQFIPQKSDTTSYRRHPTLQGCIFGSLNYWERWPQRTLDAVNQSLMLPCHRHVEKVKPECVSPKRLTYKQAMERSFESHLETDEELFTYLKKYEDEKEKSQRMQSFQKMQVMSGCIQYIANTLSRYRYQQCPKIPSLLHDGDGFTENVWTKLRVSEQMLNLWCDRLRKWICQTIIVRLVEEINDTNKRLDELGHPDLKIGEVNLFTLRQIATMHRDVFPLLPALVPYLEVALNQEYVVQRLKDLTLGGCMRLYKWNSGGFSSKKPWKKDLPYDSTLVMHLFCTYLDSLMPCDTSTAKRNFFTNNYFKQVPYKPDFQKGKHYIYQSEEDPPHYSVVIDEEIYGVPKGQDNVFSAILLFLHYIKTKENGCIGRVKLGPSGLNINWVLDW